MDNQVYNIPLTNILPVDKNTNNIIISYGASIKVDKSKSLLFSKRQ